MISRLKLFEMTLLIEDKQIKSLNLIYLTFLSKVSYEIVGETISYDTFTSVFKNIYVF